MKKKMSNMLKRILCKWLKRRIMSIESCTQLTVIKREFEWVYNSPLHTWRDKLYCIRCKPFFEKEFYDWLASSQKCSTDIEDTGSFLPSAK